MKTKNIFSAIFGIAFFLALASMVSAGIWFDFEADPSANSMTVSQGAQLNLVLTASSHNNIVVSSEKLEAVGIGMLNSWNEQGTKYGSTYLWTKTQALDTNTLGVGTFTLRFSAVTNNGVESADLTLIVNPVDTTAPVITILGNNPDPVLLNSTYIPTDAEGNVKQCWYSLDGGVTNSTAVTCVNGTSNLFSGLIPQQGTNTWTVYANDIAGNLGNTSVTFTVNDLIA